MIKHAFVTGGSHGIGRGIVLSLARAGMDVAFTYNSRKEDAEAVKEEVNQAGRRCFFYQASMEEEGVAEEATGRAIEDLGGIDVLACNAGRTIHNDTVHLERDTVDFIYRLNYRSYLMCAKVAAADMEARACGGSIVFIASTRGIRAYPEDSVYGGMKAALIRSAQSMALDLAKEKIRVNCVAPGATKIDGKYSAEDLSGGFAPKIPLSRFGSPFDIGAAVRFLASDDAAYVTGETLRVDGGLILPGMPEH